jgi:drug/metabolite transporter (DMT)-like permease
MKTSRREKSLDVISSPRFIIKVVHRNQGETKVWLAAAVLTAVCFGINNTLLKWSTRYSMSKQHIQFYFYTVAFFIMVLYGWMTKSMHPSMTSIVLGAFIGIYNATGNIQILNCLVVVVLGCYLFKERLKSYQLVGIVTALFGLILTKL